MTTGGRWGSQLFTLIRHFFVQKYFCCMDNMDGLLLLHHKHTFQSRRVVFSFRNSFYHFFLQIFSWKLYFWLERPMNGHDVIIQNDDITTTSYIALWTPNMLLTTSTKFHAYMTSSYRRYRTFTYQWANSPPHPT